MATAVAASALFLGGGVAAIGTMGSAVPSFTVLVGATANPSDARPLDGSTLTQDAYVFMGGAQLDGVTNVAWYVDGAETARSDHSPWMLGGSDGTGTPLDIESMVTGNHVISAKVTLRDGRHASVDCAFATHSPAATSTPRGTATPSASASASASPTPTPTQTQAAGKAPQPAAKPHSNGYQTPAAHASPRYAAMRATMRVAPGGGGDCSLARPCGSVADAVARAHAGSVIEVRAGSYGSQTLAARSGASGWASNVVVRPAAGAAVRFASLDFDVAHVTVTGVTVTGTVRFDTGGVRSGVDGVTISGGSAMVAATGAFVRNTRIMPNTDSDGIQVKAYDGNNPSGVSIESNVIGPTHRGPKRGHVDCIQILGGTNVSIRYNTLFHCASEGIIAGSGASGTVGSIDIERNVIQLCPQRTYDCDGYNAVNVNGPKVTFLHNTVIDGGTVFGVSNLTVAGNYIENLKSCSGTITGNLIGSTHCHLNATNRIGTPRFVNRSASPPDVRMVTPIALPGVSGAVGARN